MESARQLCGFDDDSWREFEKSNTETAALVFLDYGSSIFAQFGRAMNPPNPYVGVENYYFSASHSPLATGFVGASYRRGFPRNG
jgi:hypothetical protein